MTKFISGYDKAYNLFATPFVFLFSKSMLPRTVLGVFMLLLSVSCHHSVPYSSEQTAQFVDSSGYNTGLPATSSSQYDKPFDVKPIPESRLGLTSDDSVVVENPQAYSKRALDSAKAAMIAKSRELTTPDPIVSPVTYDTIEPSSPAAVPMKAPKSPAQKLAVAAKNAKGLPAVSVAKTQLIDDSNRELKLRKPYECACLDKQAITKGSTAYSVVRRAKAKYPDMTITRLAEINKPNVITKWQIGTSICFLRGKK